LGAEPQSQASVQDQVDAILNEPLPDREYAAPKECIDMDMRFSSSVRTEILDTSHILFFGMHNQIWLNQLRGECTGLGPGRVLVFGIQPATDTRLCRTDRFRNLDRYGSVGCPISGACMHEAAASMLCVLGEFQPVTRAQADALRIVLRNRPSTERPERKPKTTTAVTEPKHD